MAKSQRRRLRTSKPRRLTLVMVSTALISLLGFAALPVATADAVVPATIAGTGSPFAAPAVTAWANSVAQSPYNLSVNYAPSSSGQGRYEFTNGTVDYAVSDTGYVDGSVATTIPSFPFAFIPLIGAGIAFVYNIPGLTQTLQLTSYTACLVMTGQVTNWDDPVFHQNGANVGLTLPNLAIVPVTESDSAGTNLTMEQYCIHEEPAVWAQYAQNEADTSPPSGVPISATNAGANWEAPPNGLNEQSTISVATNVLNNGGSIGFVQENYAEDEGFTGYALGVAEVENASGDFTLPTLIDATSALAYAEPLPDGLAELDFNGAGPNVYNPSTVSYLLTPTAGWAASKGDTMSQFVNYALTLGQRAAHNFGYASLGQSLEQYGLDIVQEDIPGAASETSAEIASCDLTPTEVQAGQTTPTCGSGPGTGTPEVPFALALPVAAFAVFGGSIALRRRRDTRVA